MSRKDFQPGPLAEIAQETGDGEATLIFTRTLRHLPQKVWRALTEPKEQLGSVMSSSSCGTIDQRTVATLTGALSARSKGVSTL